MKHDLRSLLLMATLGCSPAFAQPTVPIEVFKNPNCGCCEKWIEHLQQSGFKVAARNSNDVLSVRKRLGMPDRLGSCHTATTGGYVIEGHVPAADIQRLLKESPAALGLAVPSMPPGSPGMEGSKPIPYQTLLVQSNGSTSVFARH